jgi:uncharacterized phage-associated protein
MARAQDAAAALITEHPGLDQMELHKLLYLAQAANLAWFREPLFADENIEAWKWGPVVRGVAGTYMQYGRKRIKEPAAGDPKALSKRDRWVIAKILEEYGDMDGPTLADLVKGPESPWKLVRGKLPDSAPSNEVITVPLMAEHHRRYGISRRPVLTMTKNERALAKTFAEHPSKKALADLFEEVTGVRPKVSASS